MQRFSTIALGILMVAAFLITGTANADTEAPASDDRAPASAKRRIQSDDVGPTIPNSFDQDMDNDGMSPRRRQKDTSTMGVQLSIYWDPLTSYQKFNPYGGPGSFTEQNASGNIFGMQGMFMLIRSHWEFATGFDYMFPITEQGQGVQSGSYVVTNQNLNIMGWKAFQVGYRFDTGGFVIVPYAGMGFYYGRDVMNLAVLGQNDQVTYSKLLADFVAGARGEYVFPGSTRFALGVSGEFIMPTKLSDSLAQSGGTTGELPGYESNLQSNMDFMTSVGFRLMGNIGMYF